MKMSSAHACIDLFALHFLKNVGEKAVDSWYSEVEKYEYNSDRPSMGTGHFTQVVWKDSMKMGVAKASSPDGRTTVVVANYHPPGNFVGRFKQNVFPPAH